LASPWLRFVCWGEKPRSSCGRGFRAHPRGLRHQVLILENDGIEAAGGDHIAGEHLRAGDAVFEPRTRVADRTPAS